MTTTRKLQWNEAINSYFSVVPKHLVEALGLKKGDKLTYRLKNNKIIITPEVSVSAKTATSEGCTDPVMDVVQHG